MNSPLIHPDTVYHALSSKPGRSERRNALKRLHEICGNQYQNGVTDFSIATIGKACEIQGILKARVLYNASSADYKALIDAWAVFGVNNISSGTEGETVDVRSAIETQKNRNNDVSRISDPGIRAHVQAIIDDRNRLRVQLSLMNAEKYLRDGEAAKKAALEEAPVKSPRGRPLKHVSEWALTPVDLNALKNAISPEFIKSQHWRQGPQGEIRDALGETLYAPGYLQGIKKMLANAKHTG